MLFLIFIKQNFIYLTSFTIYLTIRTMTYQQIKRIDEELFIKIMLRYNMHYLAYEVCKSLDYENKN